MISSQVILALALTFATLSHAAPGAPLAAYAADYHAYPKYSYAYGVKDALTGDHKEAHETRDGGVVKGSYSLLQPDGVFRTVNYVADPVHGFQAEVLNSPAPAVHAVKKVVTPAVVATPVIAKPAAVIAPVAAPVALGVGYGYDGFAHGHGHGYAAAPVAVSKAVGVGYGGHLGFAGGYAAAPVSAYGHHAALGYAGHGHGHGLGYGYDGYY